MSTAALEAALRDALRVINEQLFAIIQALRQDGITLSAAGVWETRIKEKSDDTVPIVPGEDRRVDIAEDLRQVRAQARRALQMPEDDGVPDRPPSV